MDLNELYENALEIAREAAQFEKLQSPEAVDQALGLYIKLLKLTSDNNIHSNYGYSQDPACLEAIQKLSTSAHIGIKRLKDRYHLNDDSQYVTPSSTSTLTPISPSNNKNPFSRLFPFNLASSSSKSSTSTIYQPAIYATESTTIPKKNYLQPIHHSFARSLRPGPKQQQQGNVSSTSLPHMNSATNMSSTSSTGIASNGISSNNVSAQVSTTVAVASANKAALYAWNMPTKQKPKISLQRYRDKTSASNRNQELRPTALTSQKSNGSSKTINLIDFCDEPLTIDCSTHPSIIPSTPTNALISRKPVMSAATNKSIHGDNESCSDELDKTSPVKVIDTSTVTREEKALKKLRHIDPNLGRTILNEIVIHGDKVEWKDIAGLEAAKTALKETVIYPFLRPDLFSGLREPARGMLLFGPPGTGKTMLARAVATESRSTFFSLSASSLTSKYLGESEKLVRALFDLAKELSPSVIFVDEIDSLLSSRGGDNNEHEASRRLKTEFLVQWSSLAKAAASHENSDDTKNPQVLVLAATNLPWAIDEAARRRFVRRQYIPLPEADTRREHILHLLLHHKNHRMDEYDIEHLVSATQGYSGSDITALAKDAAMGPLRALGNALLTTAPEEVPPIGWSDFENSMQTIRPSVSKEGLEAYRKWNQEFGSLP